MARAGWGCDYSREVTILNISVKGGDYSKEAIDRGWLLFEKIRYFSSGRSYIIF